MAEKKENILRKSAKNTFASLPIQKEEAIKEEKKVFVKEQKDFLVPGLLIFPE